MYSTFMRDSQFLFCSFQLWNIWKSWRFVNFNNKTIKFNFPKGNSTISNNKSIIISGIISIIDI